MSQFPTYKFEDDDDDSSFNKSSKSENQTSKNQSNTFDSDSFGNDTSFENTSTSSSKDNRTTEYDSSSNEMKFSEVRFRSRRNSSSEDPSSQEDSFSYEKSPPKLPDFLDSIADSDEKNFNKTPQNRNTSSEGAQQPNRSPQPRQDSQNRPQQNRYGNQNNPNQRYSSNRPANRDGQQNRQDGNSDNRGSGQYRQNNYNNQRNYNNQSNTTPDTTSQNDAPLDDDSRFNRQDANYSPREMGYQQQSRPRYNQQQNTGGSGAGQQQRYPRQSNYSNRPPQQQQQQQQQRTPYQNRATGPAQPRDDRQSTGYRPKRNYEPRENRYEQRDTRSQPRENRYEQKDTRTQPRENRYEQKDTRSQPRENRYGLGVRNTQETRPYQPRSNTPSTGSNYKRRPYTPNSGTNRPFYKRINKIKGAKRLPKNFIADPTQAIKYTPLVKALTRLHYSSRNIALNAINSGRILLNDELMTKHNVIVNLNRDSIKLDDMVLTEFPERLYILIHKAKHVSGSLEDGYSSIFNNLTRKRGWYVPAGCLEKSISGLVVITNDPKHRTLSKSILSKIEKEYHCKVNKKLTREEIEIINQKLFAITAEKDTPSRIEFIEDTSKHQWIRIFIYGTSLVNIRKILKISEAEVLSMHRHRIGTITSDVVPTGAWIRLKPDLVEHLYSTLNPSESKKTTLWQQLSQRWFKSTSSEEPQ